MNGTTLALGFTAALAAATISSRKTAALGRPSSRVLRGGSLNDAEAQRVSEALREIAPVLFDMVEDEFWGEEDRSGAPKLMAELLKQNGFKVLGRGGSRVVVGLNKIYAAKVASYDDGIRQNENEAATWEAVQNKDSGLASLLMPVHFIDDEGFVLVTEIAKPCKSSDERCKSLFMDARKRLGGSPVTRKIYDAEHLFNWGFHREGFKLLDYGV